MPFNIKPDGTIEMVGVFDVRSGGTITAFGQPFAGSSHTHLIVDVVSLQTTLDAKEVAANKGVAGGYASLSANTTIPIAQIPTGSESSTVCIGNDARLSDARTPTAHNITTAHNGFPGGTTNFLREDGTWQAAGGSTPVATTTVQGKAKVDHDSAGDPVALTSAGHGAASDPHTQYQKESEKGAASGYASLDAGTKVPIAEIPTGTTSTTVCIGNDGRLSDARTPTAHATTHKSGGGDAIRLDELAAPTATVSFNAQQATSFRIENRTSDPFTPAAGTIWLRTDL